MNIDKISEIWLVKLNDNLDFNVEIDKDKPYVIANYYGMVGTPISYVYDSYESFKKMDKPLGTTTLLNIKEVLEIYL